MLFDENGYLTPYNVIKTDIETFKQVFVFNERREEIFENYLALLEIFKGFSNDSFYQWLDGSFASQKNNPNDLDIVNFIDWKIYRKFENRIRELENTFRKKRLDSYTIPIYPNNDFKQYITIYAQQEKIELFGSDRIGRPKGIIQLNF
jgi:hypothetical protein